MKRLQRFNCLTVCLFLFAFESLINTVVLSRYQSCSRTQLWNKLVKDKVIQSNIWPGRAFWETLATVQARIYSTRRATVSTLQVLGVSLMNMPSIRLENVTAEVDKINHGRCGHHFLFRFVIGWLLHLPYLTVIEGCSF